MIDKTQSQTLEPGSELYLKANKRTNPLTDSLLFKYKSKNQIFGRTKIIKLP